MQDPHSTIPIVQGILLLLHTLTFISITVSFLLIPGHIDLPAHDAVGFAVKESLLSRTFSNLLLTPAYDPRNYYRSLILTSWNEFWITQSSKKHGAVKIRPGPLGFL